MSSNSVEHVCELKHPGANMTISQGRYVRCAQARDALSKGWFSSLRVRVGYLPRNLISTSLSASLFRYLRLRGVFRCPCMPIVLVPVGVLGVEIYTTPSAEISNTSVALSGSCSGPRSCCWPNQTHPAVPTSMSKKSASSCLQNLSG